MLFFGKSIQIERNTSQTKEKARTNDSSDKNLRLSNSYVILARLIEVVWRFYNWEIMSSDNATHRKRTRNYANQFAVVDNSRNLNWSIEWQYFHDDLLSFQDHAVTVCRRLKWQILRKRVKIYRKERISPNFPFLRTRDVNLWE